MLIKSKKIKKINKFELQSIYILISSCIIQTVFKEESRMDFEKVKENEKNFNKYLENKMNDDEFTRSIFNKIFVKKSL